MDVCLDGRRVFAPDSQVTRGQRTAMAAALVRLPCQQLVCSSSDQTASRWSGQDTRSKACSRMKKWSVPVVSILFGSCPWRLFQKPLSTPLIPNPPKSLFVKEGFQGVESGGHPSS